MARSKKTENKNANNNSNQSTKKKKEKKKKSQDVKTYMGVVKPKKETKTIDPNKLKKYDLKEGDRLPKWMTEEKDLNGN